MRLLVGISKGISNMNSTHGTQESLSWITCFHELTYIKDVPVKILWMDELANRNLMLLRQFFNYQIFLTGKVSIKDFHFRKSYFKPKQKLNHKNTIT